MKLFIWDDRSLRLIDENDEYDAEVFTVVRKLFVCWKVSWSVFSDLASILSSIAIELNKKRIIFHFK